MPQFRGSDIDAIAQLLARTADVLDFREWDRLSQAFTEETEAYGGHGLAAIQLSLRRCFDECGPTHHLLGNIQIEVDGSRARSTAKYRAIHQGLGARSNLTYESIGEYHDEHERTTGGWRIVHRQVDVRMTFGDRSVLQPGPIDPPTRVSR